MRVIGNNSNEPSSKNTSVYDREEAEDHSGDDMKIVEVPKTDKVDVMSV